MEDKILWLLVFTLLYLAYCLFWGVRGAFAARSAGEYFVAGRDLPMWVFMLAATAASFSGWTFMGQPGFLLGHPDLLYRDGFQYAYASFFAIAIPFTGVLFLKRQWMLAKRFGFVTPGEMLGEYFRGDVIRLLVVLIALAFALPLLGLQLRAAGFLANSLSEGRVAVDLAMWVLAGALVLYVVLGGMRAVAQAGALQCLLLATGIAVLGGIVFQQIGSFAQFNEGIAVLTQIDQQRTPQGYSHYVAIPGVMQLVQDGPSATGGTWTGMMILTYMLALMGLQAAPTFSMLGFSARSSASFGPQQVWLSAFFFGFLLFVFSVFQGVGAHLLGANPVMNATPLAEGLVAPLIPEITPDNQGVLVSHLIELAGRMAPWLVGLLAVAALAAIQSTAAVYMFTTGAMLTRDVVKHFIVPGASHGTQKLTARIFVIGIVAGALALAMARDDLLVKLGGLAVAFGLQMWPALIAICFVPWFTRTGVTFGLVLGAVAVVLTEKVGGELTSAFGYTLPWGRWPLTMHSAFWGLAVNLITVVALSAVTQSRDAYEHRMKFHHFVREFAGVPMHRRSLIPAAWILAVVWFFFAVGPGAVLGNTVFGNPNDAETWVFGIPSIWAWQIIWWGIGVFMLWFLAYRIGLATAPAYRIDTPIEDIGDLAAGEGRASLNRA